MKIKVSKHKLNIHYRGSPRGGRTQQHAYCLRYAHFQHIESHLGKKQPQAKIPIAFLFSKIHFNNVTEMLFFYAGHLVMRSAKPANHLKWCLIVNQKREVERLLQSWSEQRVLFFHSNFRLAIPAFFRFTDVTEFMKGNHNIISIENVAIKIV